MTVVDNGVGPPADSAAGAGGHGLHNLMSRAAAFGGSCVLSRRDPARVRAPCCAGPPASESHGVMSGLKSRFGPPLVPRTPRRRPGPPRNWRSRGRRAGRGSRRSSPSRLRGLVGLDQGIAALPRNRDGRGPRAGGEQEEDASVPARRWRELERMGKTAEILLRVGGAGDGGSPGISCPWAGDRPGRAGFEQPGVSTPGGVGGRHRPTWG